MATKAQIKAAVDDLADDDDASWTASGIPSVEAVSSALGERVTREEIAAASDRTRSAIDPAEPRTDKVDPNQLEGSLIAQRARSEAALAGRDPKEFFDQLDSLMAEATAPRYARNQILQQMRLLWANGQADAKQAQDRFEGQAHRREEKREMRKSAREEAEAEA